MGYIIQEQKSLVYVPDMLYWYRKDIYALDTISTAVRATIDAFITQKAWPDQESFVDEIVGAEFPGFKVIAFCESKLEAQIFIRLME